MNNQNITNPSEDCAVMAALVTALGAGCGFWGIQFLLQGYEENDPDLKETGLRTLLTGAAISSAAPLVEKGLLPKDRLMEYLFDR